MRPADKKPGSQHSEYGELIEAGCDTIPGSGLTANLPVKG